MPEFDRKDGVFYTTRVTYDERTLFKNAGWTFRFKRKAWVTDNVNKALLLQQYAVGAAKEHLESTLSIKQALVAESWAEDTDEEFPAPEGLAYMPFQKAGIAYAVKRTRVGLFDGPGLGKTIQAIGVHNARPARNVLVICPASLKRNWQREWEKWDIHNLSTGIAHSIQESYKIDGFKKTRTVKVWPGTDVCIVNFDVLDDYDEQIKAINWDLVIVDEAHNLKTPTTVRTMCVFGGTRKANRKKRILKKEYKPLKAARHLYLTGTPILSKPAELWTLVKACDPDNLGKSWLQYVYKYCAAEETNFGLDVSGASNLDQLQEELRSSFMVRRDKKSVLSELPDKRRELVLLDRDRLEAVVRKAESRVTDALSAYERDVLDLDTSQQFEFIDVLVDALSDALDAQDGEEPDWEAAIKTLQGPAKILFTEISRAREEVALAKVGMVVEHLQRLHESGEPVIVFGYHKSVIKAIKERLEKLGSKVGLITGDVPVSKRQDVVDAFQAGHLDYILGNIIAMGVGHTMTRARFVVFAEMDWVPSLMEQAEDRAWRHGQKNAVCAQYLVVDGSIEATMAIRILGKMEVIKEALD